MNGDKQDLIKIGGFRKLLIIIALALVLALACHSGLVRLGPILLKALLAGLLFPFPC
jgi:hypothetical protein